MRLAFRVLCLLLNRMMLAEYLVHGKTFCIFSWKLFWYIANVYLIKPFVIHSTVRFYKHPLLKVRIQIDFKCLQYSYDIFYLPFLMHIKCDPWDETQKLKYLVVSPQEGHIVKNQCWYTHWIYATFFFILVVSYYR